MENFNRREFIFRIVLLGISVGIVILILFYWIITLYSGDSFTFSLIKDFHLEIPGIYLADALPIILGTMFWIIARKRADQFTLLEKQIVDESQKKSEIKRFTNNLIAGNLKSEIDFSDSDATLSDTFIKLQTTLQENRKAERERRLEDRQRNWLSEGLAEFGDILRDKAHNLEALSYAVISNLVRYMDANQGGFFLVDQFEGRTILKMSACYAYDRKKFPDKFVEWGEGLIGAVALEKKSLYTDKIPDSYLTITSGLGNANPGYLLITPLLLNNKVLGIIEIGSFHPIDQYKIQFVERVADSTATTINTMESSIRTMQLLRETQEQAEQLAKQEEKVRHNMEVLTATQKEAATQAEKFISFTNTVNHTLIRAEYDTDGKLLYANTKFLKKLGYSGNKEVEGKHISMFINDKDIPWFNSLWENLSKGGEHFEGYMKHETKLGQDLWTMATYTCMRREDGSIEKILFIAIDTTEQKKQSLDFEGEIKAINRLSTKAVFLPDGKLISNNELFEKTLKYTQKELLQLNVFDFIGTTGQEQFNEIWDKVIRGDAFQGQLQMKTRYEENVWLRATFTSIDDMYGDVEKVIFLANEITREKEIELASRKQQSELLKKEEELRMSDLDLRKKLDTLNEQRQLEKLKLQKDIKLFLHIVEQLPYPVLSINNLGFLLFINKQAEKMFGLRKKNIIGSKISGLFSTKGNSNTLKSFIDPSKTKPEGIHRNQRIVLMNQKELVFNITILKTEMEEEIHYTMFLRP